MSDREELREKLIAGAQSGDLLRAILDCTRTTTDERDDLAHEVAALHNDGTVDVIAAYRHLKNGPEFFQARDIFEKALPHLNAPVLPVMCCVLHLYREAGNDMAAGMIFDPYVEFCLRDLSRPRQALKEIEQNPASLVDLLSPTISAGSQRENAHFLEEAIRLTQSPDHEVCRRAAFAVGRIRWPEGIPVPDTALGALERLAAANEDDQTRANIVVSAFELFRQDPTTESRVVDLLMEVLATGREHTLYAASTVLWRHTDSVPPKLLDSLLKQLRRVDPGHKGTLNNIDYALSNLLKNGEHEKAIEFVEELLVQHPRMLTLETFASTASGIRKSGAITNKVATRWFVRGEPTLCQSASQLVEKSTNEAVPLEVDSNELGQLDATYIIFVARKAIGYLFATKSVAAASFLISLIRISPDAYTLNQLGALLYDPLLLNYTGDVREYVTGRARVEEGETRKVLDEALRSIEEYLTILREVPPLPSLQPSQTQLESYRRFQSDFFSEALRTGRKKSPLFGLFKHQTMLYGRTSIAHIDDGEDQPRRMVFPLASHSVSTYLPRMLTIDHFGLEYKLYLFRSE